MTSIAHAAEGFYLPSLDDFPPDASHYWIGTAPRLGAPDGSTAYAGVEYDTPTFVYVGAQLTPFTLSGDATVSLQARTRGGTAGEYEVEVWLTDINDSVSPVYMYPALTETDEWQAISTTFAFADISHLAAVAAAGELVVLTIGIGGIAVDGFDVSWIDFSTGDPTYEGVLAIDTHDHPFHVVGTRDPVMPYELVIDTGTQRLVEIIAGEEALATHELVIDETGRPGDPWTHCGLFRPL